MRRAVLSIRPVKSKLFRLLRLVALCYLLFCVLLALLQRYLIYCPFHETEPAMLAQARAARCEPWRDARGALIGWKSMRLPGPLPAHRLVVFHGNAGYALHRGHYLEGFGGLNEGNSWEVFLFEYPGYGARPGKISEASFIKAGGEALDALAAADPRPIYFLGESLGSGLACALARLQPQRVAGLFLVTPFASLAGVAAHHYPFLPVRLLLHDRWDNEAALRDYPGPLAVFLAEEDEIVTAAQGRQLYDHFGGRKQLFVEPGVGHNDFTATAVWWRPVSDFLLSDAPTLLSPP
jgi:hypothetical protein